MATVSKQALIACVSLTFCLLVNVTSSGVAVKRTSSRMSRMPNYYGKRSSVSVANNGIQSSQGNSANGGANSFIFLLHSAKDRSSGVSLNSGRNLALILTKRLTSGYGRSSTTSPPNFKFNKLFQLSEYTDSVSNGKRKYKTFSRFPEFVGKRSVTPSHRDLVRFATNEDLENLKSDIFFYGMPVFNGRRFNAISNDEFMNAEKDMIIHKKNVLRRLPTFYGKRAHADKPQSEDLKKVMVSARDVDGHQAQHLIGGISQIPLVRGDKDSDVQSVLSRLLETVENSREVATNEYHTTAKVSNDAKLNTYVSAFDSRTNDDTYVNNNDKSAEVNYSNEEKNVDKKINVFSKRRFVSPMNRMSHILGSRKDITFLVTPTKMQHIYQIVNHRDDNLETRINQDNMRLSAFLKLQLVDENKWTSPQERLRHLAQTNYIKHTINPNMEKPRTWMDIPRADAIFSSGTQMSNYVTKNVDQLSENPQTRSILEKSSELSKDVQLIQSQAMPNEALHDEREDVDKQASQEEYTKIYI